MSNLLLKTLLNSSAVEMIILKATFLLSVAWAVHYALLKVNPRWRVMLWRCVLLALIILPLAEFQLPKVPLEILSNAKSEELPLQAINQEDAPARLVEREGILPSNHRSTDIASALPKAISSSFKQSPKAFGVLLKEYSTIILLSIWAVIAGVLLLRIFFAWRGIKKQLIDSRAAPESIQVLFREVSGKTQCRQKIELRMSPKFNTPFLTGVFKPVIVIPEKMTQSDMATNLSGILTHELSHVQSKDLFWMTASRCIQALWWFHPLVWKLGSAHTKACENVCDIQAANLSRSCSDYMRLLARLALEVNDDIEKLGCISIMRTSEITVRIQMIQRHIATRTLGLRKVLFAGLVGISLLGALAMIKPVLAAQQAPIPKESSTPLLTTEVKVVDESGKPVPGAIVQLDGMRAKERSTGHYALREDHSAPEEYVTDKQGTAIVSYPRYVTEDLETGYISFSVLHPDYCPIRPVSYKVDGSEVPVVLEKGAIVKVSGFIDTEDHVVEEIYPQLDHTPVPITPDLWQKMENHIMMTKQVNEGNHFLRLIHFPEDGRILFSKTVFFDAVKLKTYEYHLKLESGVAFKGKLDESVPRPVTNGEVILSVGDWEGSRECGLYIWQKKQKIDADGSFEFESLPPGEAELIARCEGFISEDFPDDRSNSMCIPQRVTLKEDSEEIIVPMQSTSTFEGTLVNLEGEPVEGAEVAFYPNVYWHQRFTNVLGMAWDSAEYLRYGRDYKKRLGSTFASAKYAATADDKGKVRISNLPGKTQSGHVTHEEYELPPDTSRYSVRRFTVEFEPGKTIKQTITIEPKGTHKIAKIQEGELSKASEARCAINDPSDPSAVEVEPEENPHYLSGQVVDAQGEPLQGVIVDAWSWYSGNETKTDAKGNFKLEGFDLDQKTIEVRFSKEGFSPRYMFRQPLGTLKESLVMDSNTYFEGTVTGPDGKTVPQALIRATPPQKRAEGVTITEVWTTTTTDENGRYRLYVQADSYKIVLRHAAGVARLDDMVIEKDQALQLDIQLNQGVVFKAKVLDSRTQEPVADLKLYSWSQKGIEGISNKEGILEIAGMPEGKFEFNVEGETIGLRRWWSDSCMNKWQRRTFSKDPDKKGWQRNFDNLAFDLRMGMEPVTIIVEKGARIRGKVLDPEGNPVTGATVGPALTGTGNSLTGDTRFSARSNEAGSFEMLLPASNNREYNIMVHDGGYQEWRKWGNGVLPPFKTTPGQEMNDVVISLTRPASVHGRAVDQQGNPVAKREVRASAYDKMGNRYYDPTTRTDDQGYFKLDFIRPGKHYIQVAPFWLSATEAPEGTSKLVELKEGETIKDVQLTTAK